MDFIKKQFANVIEWEEFRDDMIFWKWHNEEVKKGSKIIIRPGQDAIFFSNGKIEGIFEQDGEYQIASDIIPFLSTLKGFKFGFNSGMRVEILFVNTKEFTVKWGTRQPIMIPAPQLPGGLPIRANGTFQFKAHDYVSLIDKIAGMKNSYLVEDVKIRITAALDQLLMKWISREGKDMFNLQANASAISAGIREDLDMELLATGLSVTGFQVMSFSYPAEIQEKITRSASYEMIGNLTKYQQVAMTDGIASGNTKGGGMAGDMASMMIGMNVANDMIENMRPDSPKRDKPSASSTAKLNFCPNCGVKNEGANFCPNCGEKLAK
ncbi:SPFH domain-containing protein [Paenibacillus yanchengensis]|uniref:SPFH domain-containing protein n=1 Tax=Paenibacillus yanchengensis TaxID=2035833 RepID=A0ABW4YJK5_9BACL